MPWHPVPRRAASAYWRAGTVTCSRRIGAAYLTCSLLIKLRLLISFVIYKEAALGLWFLFWFHQGRIPFRMCRFYCCLAAHQRTKEKDSAEPLSSILWTPPPHPGDVRCGGAYLLPRAYTNLGFLCPVQTVHPHFDVSFGCFVFGLRSLAFQKISLGLDRTFFIIGRIDCTFLRLHGVLL